MKKNLIRAAFSMFMLIVFTTSAYPQWVQTNWSASNSFFNLYTSQGLVFARTWDSLNGGRMFLTDDNGAKWTQISSAEGDLDVLSIIMWNNTMLAGTWNGFYRSTLGDPNWEALAPNRIPADTAIWSLAMVDKTLFAGTAGCIYKSSTDDTNTWTIAGVVMPMSARITSIVAKGNALFAGTDSSGVFTGIDGGLFWEAVNSGLGDTHISQLAVAGAKLFAVTLKGVFVSDSNGVNWAADNSGLKNVNCLLAVNDLLLAGTDNNGVHLSADAGLTWTPFSSGMPDGTRVWSLAASSDKTLIFAGTSSGLWRTAVPTATTATSTKTGS
jgi:hypothetical protein